MAKRRFRSRGRFRRIRRRRGGARRLKKFVNRVVKRMSEIKYVTTADGFNFDAFNSRIIALNPSIPQGVDKTQRIGNKIQYKRMSLRFNFWIVGNATAVPNFTQTLRLMIFQPRVAFSNPAATLDIFDTNNWMSTIKGTAVRVMYDKFFTVTPQQSATAAQLATNTGRIMKKIQFRINNNVTFRDSTVSAPTDYKDQYYAYVSSSVYDTTPNEYNLQGQWFVRISYIDV